MYNTAVSKGWNEVGGVGGGGEKAGFNSTEYAFYTNDFWAAGA